MKQRVVYVGGPFRGPNHWAIAQNIRRAEELALEVWRLGAVALSPHLNSMHFDGVLPDETWLKGDLELLSRCDAMILTAGWRESAGTLAEVQHADTTGKPVFEHLQELALWLGSKRYTPADRPAVPAEEWLKGYMNRKACGVTAPHNTIFRLR